MFEENLSGGGLCASVRVATRNLTHKRTPTVVRLAADIQCPIPANNTNQQTYKLNSPTVSRPGCDVVFAVEHPLCFLLYLLSCSDSSFLSLFLSSFVHFLSHYDFVFISLFGFFFSPSRQNSSCYLPVSYKGKVVPGA